MVEGIPTYYLPISLETHTVNDLLDADDAKTMVGKGFLLPASTLISGLALC